jgi:RNA polymerase sigma factor (TIGR02999 family)
MSTNRPSAVPRLLTGIQSGDHASFEQLLPIVYDELREIAARQMQGEAKGNSLQPTALVHEAYLKLVDQTGVDWRGRTHFVAVAAQAMRRILVDHARHRRALKRGGAQERITLDERLAAEWESDEDLLTLEAALEELSELDPRQARIVELRFFGGLQVAEVAEALGMSKRSVEREWTMIRAWLRRALGKGGAE